MTTLSRTLGFILLAMYTWAFAQAGVGISPPRVEFEGITGSTTQELIVDNPSTVAPTTVSVSLSDAVIQPNGEVVFLDPGSHPNSLTSWLSLSALQLELEPEATETLSYTVEVPEATPDGSYWGIIFFETQAVQEQDVQGVGVQNRVRVGHVVYVHVGQLTKAGQIEGIRLQEGLESEVRVMFRNTGNGVVRPRGQVELRTDEGELVRTLTVPETAVLPGYASEVAARLDEPLEPGSYVALAVLDYGAASVTAGEGQIDVP